MRRGRRRTEPAENHERWLLTYADLITLLLAFFIVMYSMSRIDAARFENMSNALSGVLKGKEMALEEREILEATDGVGGGPLDREGLKMVQRDLDRSVREGNLGLAVYSVLTDRGLVIHIMEGALFEDGQADLTASARDVLRAVGSDIKKTNNHIRVEGHTDPRPIHTPRFPSNWELSTARATSVLRFMVDTVGLPPERVSALGFGEFRPLSPNDSPEGMAKNRRVDIVVLSESMSASEPEAMAVPEFDKSPVATAPE
ncbi:MAG: flagellar motor protein MotB [Candidatus Zixiibacteriota bacterium]